MSLTRHIVDKNSPVRAWFQDNLPSTGFDQFRINVDSGTLARRVNGDTGPMVISLADWWNPKDVLVLPELENGYPWGGVGTAFDYRIRLMFGLTDPRNLVASRGAIRLRDYFGVEHPLTGWRQLEKELLAVSLELGRGILEDPDREMHVCTLTYALALYEQCLRGTIAETWPIAALGSNASFAKIKTLCRDDVVEDIARLSSLFCSTQADLLASQSWHLNPRFSASMALGGADADIILDGCLLDLKTSKHADPKRAELWQLAGYALADLNDEYKIESVGLYYARYGSFITWPLGEFLKRLAGRPVDVEDLRSDFGSMLEKVSGPLNS
jgi:hypothetical protein